MELQTERHGEILLVTVPVTRIDAAVAIQFKDGMRTATAEPAPRVLLDLARVDFLDSSGLGAVVAAMKQLDPERRLELAGLTPTVAKVFRLTRMDNVFTIHRSATAALDGNSDAA